MPPELLAVNGNITQPPSFAQKTAERKKSGWRTHRRLTAVLLLSPEEWSNGWRRRTAFRVAVELLAIEEGGQEAGMGFKSRFHE